MAANTFIPGYFAAVTISGDDLAPNMASGVLTRTKNIMLKPVAGDQDVSALAGLITGSISASGHLSTQDIEKLQTAFALNTQVVYVWQIGDATAPDAGAYGGNLQIESLSFAFDTEDEWEFTLDAVLSGKATYTPA